MPRIADSGSGVDARHEIDADGVLDAPAIEMRRRAARWRADN